MAGYLTNGILCIVGTPLFGRVPEKRSINEEKGD